MARFASFAHADPGLPSTGWWAQRPTPVALVGASHIAGGEYSFCSDGKRTAQPLRLLMYDFVDPTACNGTCEVFGQAGAKRLLRGLWVHIDGDSLSREMFFDLVEMIEGSTHPGMNCPRERTHPDRQYCGHGLRITFAWNYAFARAPSLASAEQAGSPVSVNETAWGLLNLCSGHRGICAPDVWIWSPGKWFGVYRPPDPTQFELMALRIKRMARRHAAQAGTRFVLRTITPYRGHPSSMRSHAQGHFFELDYANTSNWTWFREPSHRLSAQEMSRLRLSQPPGGSLDDFHEWIYWTCRRIFRENSLLDAWNMMATRQEAISGDGTHARGVLSKMVTNVLLNLVSRKSKSGAANSRHIRWHGSRGLDAPLEAGSCLPRVKAV